jgi:site-specific recombinase XerD
MKTPDLANLLPRFFTEHMVEQRNLSSRTVTAYRDTFRLLLRFLQRSNRAKPAELSLQVLTASNVLDFLSHLERERHNSVRSRNARLAAIRSFLHYASDLLGPELPEPTRRVLSIPWKRHSQPLLGFLSREEVQAILTATDSSWTGRRDQLLFQLLYNSGARVSEIIAVRVRDVLAGDGSQIQLHGKGRKHRVVPLWRQTQKQVRRWIKENELAPDAPLLPNRFGQPLSRSGVAWQLRRWLRKASSQVPSLERRRISPHTFRHTIAMHLLQSGVAPEIIALWLGHESPNTTHLYVEADLEMKRRTLDKITPIRAKRQGAKPSDPLLRFLDQL